MAKIKSVFVCQSCGTESAKWVGKCPSCGEWNTYVEEVVSKTVHSSTDFSFEKSRPVNIKEAGEEVAKERLKTGIDELDRVLGGGIVDGSLVLVGGEKE